MGGEAVLLLLLLKLFLRMEILVLSGFYQLGPLGPPRKPLALTWLCSVSWMESSWFRGWRQRLDLRIAGSSEDPRPLSHSLWNAHVARCISTSAFDAL